MSDRYTIKLYNNEGGTISICGVANPMLGFMMLAAREGLDYCFATCYLHRQGEPPIVQWELEIK